MTDAPSPRALRIAAITAVAFGVLTIVSGASALFGSIDMGAVVPFVLWFNFLAGFAYVAAGVGLWQRRRWGWLLAVGILLATLAVAAAFAVHALQGGAYEMRTVGALGLRSLFWLGIVAAARDLRRAAG